MNFKKYLNLRFGEIEKDEIVKGLFVTGAAYTLVQLVHVLFVNYIVALFYRIPLIGSAMSMVGSVVTFLVIIIKPILWIIIIKLLCEVLNKIIKEN